MKKEDIRVGNSVLKLCGSLGWQIHTVKGHTISKFDDRFIKGIPITIESIKCLGFIEITSKSGSYKLKNFGSINFSLNTPCFQPSGLLIKTIYRNRVSYIHELQNLYFAVTGEELVYVS